MIVLWFIGGLVLGCAIGWLLHWERQAKAYSARATKAAQTRRSRKAGIPQYDPEYRSAPAAFFGGDS